MKFNLQLLARLLIPIFLGSAGISAYYANQLAKSFNVEKSKISQLEKDLAKAKSDQQDLATTLKQDATTIKFEETFSKVLLDIQSKRIAHGVSVYNLAVDSRKSSATIPLSELAEKIEGTSVKTAKISIKGNYTNYAEFQAYLQDLLVSNPVAITGLQITNKTFDLSLRLYGN